MYEAAAQLARTLNVDKDGYRVVMNCNSNGGQTVYHIHLPFGWEQLVGHLANFLFSDFILLTSLL